MIWLVKEYKKEFQVTMIKTLHSWKSLVIFLRKKKEYNTHESSRKSSHKCAVPINFTSVSFATTSISFLVEKHHSKDQNIFNRQVILKKYLE